MSSDSESEYSSLEDEEQALTAREGPKAQRPRINDTDALQEALEEIAWPADLPWEEAQAVTSDEPTTIADIDDDLERELAFYNQALGAARVAIAKMEAAGVPWRRPPDYYAEMVKSDDHMLKVREQLAFEQKTIEEAAQRRKQREAKKFGKQVQAEVRKERAASKKAAVDSMTKLRKQRAKSGYEGELDVDAVINGGRGGSRGGGRGGRGGRGGGRDGPSKKRLARDEKFGFGGRKRAGKRNDASSAADMRDFKTQRGGGGRGGGRGGRGGRGAGGRGAGPGGPRGGGVRKGGKSNRPGKARRAAVRGE